MKTEFDLRGVKIYEHLNWLRKVHTEGTINDQVFHRAMETWYVVYGLSDMRISVPAACTGSDGEVFYSWNRDEHHLEIEIVPNKPTEVFYRNRKEIGLHYYNGSWTPRIMEFIDWICQ